jgi:putative cell wall-binding protein
LLTRPGSLPDVVAGFLSEVANVRDSDIYVVGGTAAVSDNVVDEITDIFGWDAGDVATYLRRLDGKDRYETASSVALAAADAYNDANCLIVATGENFPDALAAGSVAVNGSNLNDPTQLSLAGHGDFCPVLLTRTNSLSEAAAEVLESTSDIDLEIVLIIGGTAAVSTGVENTISDLLGIREFVNSAPEVGLLRIGGANRYETAANIANFLNMDSFDGDGYPTVYNMPEEALLVSGTNFPDALSAAPLTRGRTPILLTQPSSLSAPTNTWIGWNRNEVNTVTAIGGTAAVSEAALGGAVGAAAQVAPTVLQSLGLILDEVQPFVELSGSDVTLTAKAGSALAFPDGNGWELAIVARQLTPVVQTPTFSVNAAARIVTIGVPTAGFPDSTVTIQEFRAAFNALSGAKALFDLFVEPGIDVTVDLDNDDFEFADGVAVGLNLNVLNTQCEATNFTVYMDVKLGLGEQEGVGLCGDNTQQIFTLWDNALLQNLVVQLLTVQLGRTPTAAELQAFAETLPKGPLMVVPGDVSPGDLNSWIFSGFNPLFIPDNLFNFSELFPRLQIDPLELRSSGSSELENLTRIRINITWLKV